MFSEKASLPYTFPAKLPILGKIIGFTARIVLRKKHNIFRVKLKDGSIYLERHIILKSKMGNIYYHRFFQSDDESTFHNHPWNSISITTKGKTKELVPRDATRPIPSEFRSLTRSLGSIVIRRRSCLHRIAIPENGQPSETLIITGPSTDDWQFCSPSGRMFHWRRWLNIPVRQKNGSS